ncbi:hypothetical protein KFL_000090350 [Klebsormidium nitens]|uniref:Uncharacterized protein n=1 Tax=Klebsormidium nitens TaxID=105231 RepID=A0A1Y1HLZ3_KLENI|nr:hypothetical protein KFL_000090350 [Klebsormidium nitens]|eukprot:GAQ78189.1 hypothetical protein KFL_000090350 [Klebsormidium nitens]
MELQAEGVRLGYSRASLTDGKAPKSPHFDASARNISRLGRMLCSCSPSRRPGDPIWGKASGANPSTEPERELLCNDDIGVIRAIAAGEWGRVPEVCVVFAQVLRPC